MFADRAASTGRERGRDAAAWVFNDTTSTGTGRHARTGGSQHLDFTITGGACEPSSTGERPGGWPGGDLAGSVGIRTCGEYCGDAATAYHEAASEAFWEELERLCRVYLADGGPPTPPEDAVRLGPLPHGAHHQLTD